jgi:hypothetical protein
LEALSQLDEQVHALELAPGMRTKWNSSRASAGQFVSDAEFGVMTLGARRDEWAIDAGVGIARPHNVGASSRGEALAKVSNAAARQISYLHEPLDAAAAVSADIAAAKQSVTSLLEQRLAALDSALASPTATQLSANARRAADHAAQVRSETAAQLREVTTAAHEPVVATERRIAHDAAVREVAAADAASGVAVPA